MHTDKPISLSVRDYIVRRLSSHMRISEDVISSVVSHQYSSGNAATKNVNEVEFSGLGKFLFSQKKAKNKLEQFLEMKRIVEGWRDEGKRVEYYEKKLVDINEYINYIKTKLDVKN